MKNKPKCLFCKGTLEAEAVTVNKSTGPYYSLGRSRPLIVPLPDEIILQVKCPKCGAYGDALGDKVLFSGNKQYPIVEIDNASVGRLMSGNGLVEAFHPKLQPFNPSRRDNCPK